ncbi:hypothetical protein [Mucilaginibacter sp. CSA2-8R]|uniref:hypothetical protein n=1 Tax=Mucilaginibacter sp. CSA2-8R TaxID=3141542 RepID=UPI00315D16E4
MKIDSIKIITDVTQSESLPVIEFKLKVINFTNKTAVLFTGQDYNLHFGDTSSFFSLKIAKPDKDLLIRQRYFLDNALDTAFKILHITKLPRRDILISPHQSETISVFKDYNAPVHLSEAKQLLYYLNHCKITYVNRANIDSLKSIFKDCLIIKNLQTNSIDHKLHDLN